MASVGGVYLNFGLWATSLIPAWLVISKIGVSLDGEKVQEKQAAESPLPVDCPGEGKI